MSVLKKIAASLKENGYLIVGKDEFLPLTYPNLLKSHLKTPSCGRG